MNAKHALLCSIAATLCITTAPVFAGDASQTWLDYQIANGLPVDPIPSKSAGSSDELLMELSLTEGNTDRAGLARAIQASRGNGNGRPTMAKYECRTDFFKEMSKSDGSVLGDDRSCDSKAS